MIENYEGFQGLSYPLCTIGRTGGGSAFFASLTRRHLFPWEDGSPR
jgi:hypothetical protein